MIKVSPMNASLEKLSGPSGGVAQCLARSVVDTLAEEPALEAVTIDRAHQKISVATLGRTDVTRLTERLTTKFQAAEAADPSHACSLLNGRGDCLSCDTPLSETERRRITIQNNGPSTTIARVTCPTAPKFWRWRDMPLPKVVQRDVEFLESAERIDEHIDEWKPQLAAAMLCGVFGLGGHFLSEPATGRWRAYVLAYLAGGWFTGGGGLGASAKARDRRAFSHARRRGRRASIGAWGEGATLLFLFSFSGALEHYALGRTQREIRSLFREAPKVATVLDDQGQEREVQGGKAPAGACACSSSPAPSFRWTLKLPGADRQRRIQSYRRSHAGGKGHRRHRPRRHHQSLGRGRSGGAAAGGGEFAAKDHHPHQGRPAAEGARAAVH